MADLHLLSPQGFRASGVYAGIKTTQVPDVGLLICDGPAAAAAAFTTNKVVSAAVTVGKNHVRGGRLRGVVVNSGNANACTGRQGEKDALRMCQLAAEVAQCEADQFLPSSTGIIGHMLPMEKIEKGIGDAGQYMGDSQEHALRFGDCIMTTDTRRKTAAVEVRVGKERIIIAGIAKGAGMIGPRISVPQATMLSYITTDARIAPAALRKIFQGVVQHSYNCVTIDDHMSTNDTAVVLASGLGAAVSSSSAQKAFAEGLSEVCQSLAYQIAADGEGATKVVTVKVSGARSEQDGRTIARTIANSPLVKCAMHGNDPNWGRIVSAAGIPEEVAFDPARCELRLQGTVVFRKGTPAAFDAGALSKALDAKEVLVDLRCGLGKATATVWTCDLSREYIAINADYHT